MAIVSVANPISTYHPTYMGDTNNSPGTFLGWIRLARPDGTDAGYIYLSNSPVGGHLGGPANARYIVMSRPIAEALTVIDFLKNGSRLVISYYGDEGGGGSTMLTEGLTAISAEFREDVGKRLGLKLDDR